MKENLKLNRITVAFRGTAVFCDRWHWVLLALTAPFLLFPSPQRSPAMLVVPASWLLHWFVVSKKQRAISRQVNTPGRGERSAFRPPPSALPLTPLNGSLLLLSVMVLVSLWATYDIAVSLPKISGMVLGMGVFFAVAREGERPLGWILSMFAFLGIGLGITALGVFGTSWSTYKITLFNPITSRLPGFITGLQGAEAGINPNEVAGALVWVLPLMMTISVAMFLLPRLPHRPAFGRLAPAGSRPERGAGRNEGAKAIGEDWLDKMRGWRLVGVTILSLTATFFVTAVFLLSQSRGGYMGIALTLPALILIALPPRWRWYSLALLALLAIILGVLFASRWEAARIEVTGFNLASDPARPLNTTIEGRLEIWSRAIYGIQDFPFTGMGMNAFRKVVPVLYPLFNISPEVDIGHAHNEFLQAALDLGIPGLIAFIGLYIGAFWMLTEIWKFTRHPPPNTDHCSQFTAKSPKGDHCEVPEGGSLLTAHYSLFARSLTLGLGGGLLAHLLYGLTDAVALGAKPGVLLWMLLGLIAGLHRQAQEYWAVVDSNVPATELKMDNAND